MNKNILYRNIPKVDVLLENPQIVKLIEKCHCRYYKRRNKQIKNFYKRKWWYIFNWRKNKSISWKYHKKYRKNIFI